MKGFLKTGAALRILPHIDFFTLKELRQSICDAEFEIEDEWQPDEKAAIFIAARKSA